MIDFGYPLYTAPRRTAAQEVEDRRMRAHRANTFKAAEEALSALSGDDLTNIVYTILADHPGLAPDQLEGLANRLGRAAHERARHD